MTGKVRWGILSTANIALTKVIPGVQRSSWCEITAIASRDLARARESAEPPKPGSTYSVKSRSRLMQKRPELSLMLTIATECGYRKRSQHDRDRCCVSFGSEQSM